MGQLQVDYEIFHILQHLIDDCQYRLLLEIYQQKLVYFDEDFKNKFRDVNFAFFHCDLALIAVQHMVLDSFAKNIPNIALDVIYRYVLCFFIKFFLYVYLCIFKYTLHEC
jgi:hypothetical protein